MKTTFFSILFFLILSCNHKNKNDDSETSEKEIETSIEKKLTIDEINENILNTYIDGLFEIEKELDNPISYHDNGLISSIHLCTIETNNSICIYKNSQHEKRISFYKNGKLSSLYERMGGKYHGEYLQYYENGQPAIKYFYQFGQKHGEQIHYFLDGKISLKFNYKNGVRDGESISYYIPGKLKEKKEFRNGISIGDSFRYYESGKVEQSCSDGVDFRYCKNYDENGKISNEMKCNLITGNLFSKVYFDEDGNIKEEKFFDQDGNVESNSKVIQSYDENGKIIN
jgi:antitoxin component YwqK of YwqJK toxin-antitoxin module